MHPSATPISSLPFGHQDLARAIVDGLLAGRPVMAVIDVPGIASKPVIDAALSALEEQQTRIVRVEENSISVLGPPISAMDRLSEFAAADAEGTNGRNASPDLVAQIKRGLRVLGYRPFGERRRLLVVELVQFVPPETIGRIGAPDDRRSARITHANALCWRRNLLAWAASREIRGREAADWSPSYSPSRYGLRGSDRRDGTSLRHSIGQ